MPKPIINFPASQVQRTGNSQVKVEKRVNHSTKEKRYVPVVREKELRLSWKTHTMARAYGEMAYARYVRLLNARNEEQ